MNKPAELFLVECPCTHLKRKLSAFSRGRKAGKEQVEKRASRQEDEEEAADDAASGERLQTKDKDLEKDTLIKQV